MPPAAGVKKPTPVAEGLCFPITEQVPGGEPVRSTQVTGKAIIAAAVKAADKDAAQKVVDEKKWRFKYKKHFVKMVEVGCKSPDAALAIANAGLDYMYDNFDFVRDGKTHTLRRALEDFKGTFSTGVIKGTKQKPSAFELEVPYNGTVLKGDALQQQLDKWVRSGVIEMSAGSAISQVAQSAPWLDLSTISSRYFVLLGAGAAMGPLQVLLALGANVIAVDVPETVVPNIWHRILDRARDSCGTLTFPLKAGVEQKGLDHEALCAAAGCDLFKQTPEVKNWLLACHPKEKLVVGGYAYIPGEQFPRVALAMDAIIKYLTEKRQAAVAFLCTPTDCHLVPAAAHAAARAAHARAPLWQTAFAVLSNGSMCAKNARKPVTSEAGELLYPMDALVVAQGPNYALAKRLQHWRAMVARDIGCIVSSNIAPSTKTASVTQNKMFAYAYEMLPCWKPYEVPGPETSNAVMTALLLHDLNEPMHAGNPSMPLANPQQIFSQGGFHGGTWRCAHTFDSIGTPAVILYYLKFFVVKNYLLAYNVLQALGWALTFYRAANHYAAPAGTSPWSAFGETLVTFQYLAMLEVLHALTGMVRAPVGPTAIQIASRVAVVAIADHIPAAQTAQCIYLFAFAWSFTEVVRYSWYALNLLGKPPAALTWLRYSTFLVLYPAGVTGELLLYAAALPALDTIPVFGGVTLGAVARYAVFPGYVPGLPGLYFYMLTQRKKALASLRGAAKKKSE